MIGQFENNKNSPTIETIRKILSALGVSEYELQGVSSQDIIKSFSETTSFYNYLLSIGYEVYESQYGDSDWVLHIKNAEKEIFISDKELMTLESTTKENIELRIDKYLHDGEHFQ